MRYDRKDEAESDHRADKIAGYHDAFAVEAVEDDTGERAHGDSWDCARQENTGDHHARMCECHGQRKDGNVIEVVADFADDLAGPHIAIVAIPAEQFEEIAHQLARSCDGFSEGSEAR